MSKVLRNEDFYFEHLTKDDIEEYNILNIGEERNIKNTEKWRYNCLGYALNIFLWITLQSDIEFEYYHEEGIDIDDYNDTLEKDWLEDLIELTEDKARLIKDRDEVEDNEYLVYFRLGRECCVPLFTDFHFIKEMDGIVSHKMGGLDICEFEDDPMDIWDFGDMIYDGTIYLFAVQR